MRDALQHMAAFVEVAKLKSFTKAATSLGVSKSTLSRKIVELEASLRLQLFKRTTRSVELTEAGTLYHARCKDIVEAAHLAHEQLSEMVETPRGKLRLSMTPDFATAFMAPMLVEFGRRYPEVEFDLDLSPRVADLISENFDLAIRLGDQPSSGLIARTLCRVRTALYATPSFLASHAAPQHPKDLKFLPCITNPNIVGGSVWRLSKGKTVHAVEVAGQFRANNPGVIRRLGMFGAGIIALDETVAASDVRSKRLTRVLPDWSLPATSVTAVMPTRLVPAKTRILLDFLASELRTVGLL